jgi:hypothetical protein
MLLARWWKRVAVLPGKAAAWPAESPPKLMHTNPFRLQLFACTPHTTNQPRHAVHPLTKLIVQSTSPATTNGLIARLQGDIAALQGSAAAGLEALAARQSEAAAAAEAQWAALAQGAEALEARQGRYEAFQVRKPTPAGTRHVRGTLCSCVLAAS